ncbi:peptidase S28 [Xylariomycetidae sp. FL0641]|nr:peptidase S28 [Xylariomycetidae sp. FL0641]
MLLSTMGNTRVVEVDILDAAHRDGFSRLPLTALAAALLPLLAQSSHVARNVEKRDFQSRFRNRFGIKGVDLGDDELDKVGNATFEQLLDHNDPSKGTFSQRFWWNAEFYEEDGPIFLFNPGENSASGFEGYTTNRTLPGYYAQQLKGAAIVIEHRYWGESNPFEGNLTAETLQDLNLPNSVKDMTYFAKNVDCDFCEGGTCNSDENPWVLVGGSYSGALAAWTSQLDPGTFAAYHASSAVVEAIKDFWAYFSPIEQALPEACSRDVRAVVSYVDSILSAPSSSNSSKAVLKARFGLSALNDADFADQLADPVGQWQSDQAAVLSFCETLAAAQNSTTKRRGWARRRGDEASEPAALDAYAKYIRETSGCGGDGGIACDTYDDEILWDDPEDPSGTRQWSWMLCDEPFGWWQVGPPHSDGTNIVSSAMRPYHYMRRCPLQFPKTNGYTTGSAEGFTEAHLNKWTQGWDAPYENVIFVNGEFDPWRSATVASDVRPGGPMEETCTTDDDSNPDLDVASFIVKGGNHVPELFIDPEDQNTFPIAEESVKIMKRWIDAWTPPAKASRSKQ